MKMTKKRAKTLISVGGLAIATLTTVVLSTVAWYTISKQHINSPVNSSLADLSYYFDSKDFNTFSESNSYNVDDIVKYNDKVYSCTTAHSAGAWNSEHFTEIDPGTADNPFVILQPSHLHNLMRLYNDSNAYGLLDGVVFEIGKLQSGVYKVHETNGSESWSTKLDMSTYQTDNVFRPIGFSATNRPFTSIIKGNGVTIDKLHVKNGSDSNRQYFGVFGYITTGTVDNIKFTNLHIYPENTDMYSGFYTGGITNYNNITNCSVQTGHFHNRVKTDYGYIGTIAGKALNKTGGNSTVTLSASDITATNNFAGYQNFQLLTSSDYTHSDGSATGSQFSSAINGSNKLTSGNSLSTIGYRDSKERVLKYGTTPGEANTLTSSTSTGIQDKTGETWSPTGDKAVGNYIYKDGDDYKYATIESQSSVAANYSRFNILTKYGSDSFYLKADSGNLIAEKNPANPSGNVYEFSLVTDLTTGSSVSSIDDGEISNVYLYNPSSHTYFYWNSTTAKLQAYVYNPYTRDDPQKLSFSSGTLKTCDHLSVSNTGALSNTRLSYFSFVGTSTTPSGATQPIWNKPKGVAMPADSFNTTYGYSDKGTTWNLTNCTDQSSYWQCPTGSNVTTSIASISDIFYGKSITSAVTITIKSGTYGTGTNPSANTFKIYSDTSCTNLVTSTQSGTLPTSKSYTNAIYTVSQANAANFSRDLGILITKPGKTIRLVSITVAFSYTTGGTTYTVTYTAGSNGSGSQQETGVYAGNYVLPQFSTFTSIFANSGYKFQSYTVGGNTKAPGEIISISGNTNITVNFVARGTSTEYDFVTNFDTYADGWASSYGDHTGIDGVDDLCGDYEATIDLYKASKQSSTIDDQPVFATKTSSGYYKVLQFTLNESDFKITSVEITFTRWSSDSPTIALFKGSSISGTALASISLSSSTTLSYNNVDDTVFSLGYCDGATSNKRAGISSITINVTSTATPVTLSSIALSGTYPTSFTVGDTFSHSGMTVTATYSDSSTANVTSSATFSGYNMSVAGEYTVTVSYTEGGTTKTATYGITVAAPAKTLSSIALSGTYSTTFTVGDTFNHTGMIVTATFSDSSTENVTTSATWSSPNMSTSGQKTITVSYTYGGTTKTATYTITVNPVEITSFTYIINDTYQYSSSHTVTSTANSGDSSITLFKSSTATIKMSSFLPANANATATLTKTEGTSASKGEPVNGTWTITASDSTTGITTFTIDAVSGEGNTHLSATITVNVIAQVNGNSGTNYPSVPLTPNKVTIYNLYEVNDSSQTVIFKPIDSNPTFIPTGSGPYEWHAIYGNYIPRSNEFTDYHLITDIDQIKNGAKIITLSTNSTAENTATDAEQSKPGINKPFSLRKISDDTRYHQINSTVTVTDNTIAKTTGDALLTANDFSAFEVFDYNSTSHTFKLKYTKSDSSTDYYVTASTDLGKTSTQSEATTFIFDKSTVNGEMALKVNDENSYSYVNCKAHDFPMRFYNKPSVGTITDFYNVRFYCSYLDDGYYDPQEKWISNDIYNSSTTSYPINNTTGARYDVVGSSAGVELSGSNITISHIIGKTYIDPSTLSGQDFAPKTTLDNTVLVYIPNISGSQDFGTVSISYSGIEPAVLSSDGTFHQGRFNKGSSGGSGYIDVNTRNMADVCYCGVSSAGKVVTISEANIPNIEYFVMAITVQPNASGTKTTSISSINHSFNEVKGNTEVIYNSSIPFTFSLNSSDFSDLTLTYSEGDSRYLINITDTATHIELDIQNSNTLNYYVLVKVNGTALTDNTNYSGYQHY